MTGIIDTPLTAKNLKAILDALINFAGIDPSNWALSARVCERMKNLSIEALDDYQKYFFAHPLEIYNLAVLLRVGETRFFRHPKHISELQAILPTLQNRPVQIWSAGCATGEEAYTLSMTALETSVDAMITATDFCEKSIQVARKNSYAISQTTKIPPLWRKKYGSVTGNIFSVNETVKERTSFAQHNLIQSTYPKSFDIIWCRNVLMYFTKTMKDRVLSQLYESLNPGGFLFVGFAETIPNNSREVFRRCSISSIYTKNNATLIENNSSQPHSTNVAHVVFLRGHFDGNAFPLKDQLSEILESFRHKKSSPQLIIDLDAVSHFSEECKTHLRRASTAANATGVTLYFRSENPARLRWLDEIPHIQTIHGGESR